VAARIAPSILSADFANLAAAVEEVSAEADTLHVDVMDGHFVPNLTIGPPVVKALRARTGLYLDCHLMVDNPLELLDDFARAGANGCTVHVEIGDTPNLLRAVRAEGMDAGLAVNPDTPFEAFEPFLGEVDLLLLMTVFPGFGGQAFIRDVLPKIEQTCEELERRGLSVPIQVDGGIDEDTAPRAAAAGATVFVAGTAVFGRPSPREAARRLRAAVDGVLAGRGR
jgi:ribulose-phosphate 3-epimerase